MFQIVINIDVMLEIKNLHAEVDGTEILKGVDLKINSGEVHAIMGPNGSGNNPDARFVSHVAIKLILICLEAGRCRWSARYGGLWVGELQETPNPAAATAAAEG